MAIRQSTIIDALTMLDDLPSLPEVLYRLAERADDPEVSMAEIASEIEADPPMAVRILRIANSVHYSRRGQPVKSVLQAIVRLGLWEVRKLCLAVAATRLFVRPSTWLDHRAFWRHSLTTAQVTRMIADQAPSLGIDVEDAFVAGLLHDLGTLVLDQYFADEYGKICRAARDENAPKDEIEREFLGIDHAEIGAWLLSKWNFSPVICAAVESHHEPTQASPSVRLLSSVIHLSDYLSHLSDDSAPTNEARFVLSIGVLDDLGITAEELCPVMPQVAAENEKSRAILSTI